MIALLRSLLLCILLGTAVLVHAKTVIPGTEAVVVLDGGQLDFLRDPSRQMGLDEARSAFAQGRYKTLPGNLGLGYIPEAVWLHFTLDQTSAQSAPRWVEVTPPYLDDIRLFHIGPDGQVDERRGGDRLPQSAKEENYRAHLFKLELQPGKHDVFIRLQTTSTMAAIVKLWQPDAFASHLRNSYFAYGLYYSLILTVLLFNATNWLVSRRTIFLVYVGYLSLNALQWLGINGFVAEFIFPEQPLLANLTLGMTLSLAGAMAWMFFILVLDLKRYHPYLYRFSQFGIAISLVTAVSTPLGFYQTFAPILLVTAILSIGTMPWPAWRLWRTGELPARVLVIAYLTYGGLMSFNILGSLALLPFTEAGTYTGMASNICHIFLLHFAILLHYRRVEAERAEALEKSALAERQVALERAFREDQDKLLKMLTHEIRTPIAQIDSARQILEVLDEDGANPADPERTRRYQSIERGVKRLDAMLGIALTQTRDIPEKWHLELQPVDPARMTAELVDLLDPALASRIRLEVEDVRHPILCEPRLLRIILANLLDNAGKYSPPGSPIALSMAARKHQGQAGIGWRIEDQGVGIPHGMEERIFDKFTRLGETTGVAGMGLGLYLVRYIVERHGGKVWAEGGRASGACFELWLPAQKDTEDSQ